VIIEKYIQVVRFYGRKERLVGALGYLAVFAGSLGMIMFSSANRMILSAILCVLVALVLYPAALRRVLRLRWLFLLGSLVLVNAFWVGEADVRIWGLPLSWAGLEIGVRMALRAAVILVAADGFSSSVDISEVAGLLERLGLSGLGFSLGVAVNLLPSLRETSAIAWRSLRMRGGFRQRRWRALQLLLVTIMANALRRGEEIALAAEARAYSPDHTRTLPLKRGCLDGWILAGALVVVLAFLLVGCGPLFGVPNP
jgi:energy-coupling factor transporter transmembrane protein EcfT